MCAFQIGRSFSYTSSPPPSADAPPPSEGSGAGPLAALGVILSERGAQNGPQGWRGAERGGQINKPKHRESLQRRFGRKSGGERRDGGGGEEAEAERGGTGEGRFEADPT
eukprot:9202715-Pyramimonas_sp.AAC.1